MLKNDTFWYKHFIPLVFTKRGNTVNLNFYLFSYLKNYYRTYFYFLNILTFNYTPITRKELAWIYKR